jgi:hypothetical protein
MTALQTDRVVAEVGAGVLPGNGLYWFALVILSQT